MVSYKFKKISSLFSGCLIHIVLGATYTFGTITPYIASYIKYFGDPNVQVVDISINYPVMMISQVLGMFLSMLYLQLYLSMKMLAVIGMTGFCVSILIASFMKTVFTFVIFYGVGFGLFFGIAYMPPFKNTYAYFPNRKGMCSGVCMMGYGLGTFFYNQLFLHLVNPQNQQPDVNHFFPKDVAENFPGALRIMVGLYALLSLIGCLLFFGHKQQEQGPTEQSLIQSEIQKQSESISSMSKALNYLSQNPIKKKQLFQLFLITYLSSVYGTFMAYNYKEYGETITNNDQLITLLGSIACLANSFSRIFWNFLFDFVSFRIILTIMNCSMFIQCILCAFQNNQVIYFIIVIGSYVSHGAFYGLMPAQTFRVYGEKLASFIYPIIFVGFVSASLSQFIIHKVVITKWGNDGFRAAFISFSVLQLIGLLFVQIFNFSYLDKITKQSGIEEQSSQKVVLSD